MAAACAIPPVTVLNLNMGNVGSIPTMLKRFDVRVTVTQHADEVRQAEKLILPGVGAFDAAMRQLERLELLDALHTRVMTDRVPVLGICLGMQLLAEASEEGERPGLGWIPGRVVRFRFSADDPASRALKIPHMGWNHVARTPDMPLLEGFEADPRFYFVHAYHLDAHGLDADTRVANTRYGYEFPAMVQRGNVLGVQFHPEKSHRFGLKLLENFLRFDGTALGPPIAAPSLAWV